MAERKLRFDAAVSAAVSHPHIRMPDLQDRSESVGLSSENPVDSVPPTPSPGTSGTKLEDAVRQKLDSHPGVRISSLVVREFQDGVCLDGIIESNDEIPEVERLVRSVACVNQILNRLITRPPDNPSG